MIEQSVCQFRRKRRIRLYLYEIIGKLPKMREGGHSSARSNRVGFFYPFVYAAPDGWGENTHLEDAVRDGPARHSERFSGNHASSYLAISYEL
jgi:hypothetical protein